MLEKYWTQLAAAGISEHDVLTAVIVVCVLAFVASLVAVRRVRGLRGSASPVRTRDAVDRLRVQVDGTIHDNERKLEQVLEELRYISERLATVEARVLSGKELEAQSAREAQHLAKKKSEDVNRPPLPSPVQPVEAGLLSGLKKTRSAFFSKLRALAGRDAVSPETSTDLEELLIASDMGVKTAGRLVAELKSELGGSGQIELKELLAALRRNLVEILQAPGYPEIVPEKKNGMPMVVLVVGVNGVGKTTTIGKLAASFAVQGRRVLVGACDTFRAAAVEQLEIWAERSGISVVKGEEGAKPTTVAFQAVQKAKDEQADVLIIDTAGRLHTRVNLMNELGALVRIIEREIPGAPHETVLVVDAATGQNALQQARDFNAVVSLSGIVVTKLDGTPKGGIVVAIKDELGIPIRYVGVGEALGDLRPFVAEEFVDALLAGEEGEEVYSQSSSKAEQRIERKRREHA